MKTSIEVAGNVKAALARRGVTQATAATGQAVEAARLNSLWPINAPLRII